MVADPNTEYTSGLACCGTAKNIDVVSIVRPFVPAHTNLRQLGPLLGAGVEQHQTVHGFRKGDDVTSSGDQRGDHNCSESGTFEMARVRKSTI